MCMHVCTTLVVVSLTVALALFASWRALDEMGSRIDDLEKSIADLMEQVRGLKDTLNSHRVTEHLLSLSRAH